MSLFSNVKNFFSRLFINDDEREKYLATENSWFYNEQQQKVRDIEEKIKTIQSEIEALETTFIKSDNLSEEDKQKNVLINHQIKTKKRSIRFYSKTKSITHKIIDLIVKEQMRKESNVKNIIERISKLKDKRELVLAGKKRMGNLTDAEKAIKVSEIDAKVIKLTAKIEELTSEKEQMEYVPKSDALLEIKSLKKFFQLNTNFFGKSEADKIYSYTKQLRKTALQLDEIEQKINISKTVAGTSADENEKAKHFANIDNLEKRQVALNEKKGKLEGILTPQHIKKAYSTKALKKPKSRLKAVDGVSFSIERGKTLGIVGESGCGKTTMGRTVLRLYEANGGKIYFKGLDITGLKSHNMRIIRPQIQVIFQDPYSSLSPRLTVGEIIGEAVRTHNIVPKDEHHNYIVDIMRKCGLQEIHFNRYPHEFSGGQRQRISIARALALKPDFIVCDEPVSALDVSIQAQIINLLKDLQREMNLTYMFISHDLSIVEHISDEIGVMYLGNLVEKGTKEKIFKNPQHPYTKALFSAVPIPDPNVKMNRIMLEGDIPSPANPPPGCKFHTRCSHCMDICKEKTPKLIEYEPNHFTACHLYNKV